MWHNTSHMLMGQSAAAKSKKTPAHLIPHLQKASMKLKGNSPTTGAATQMKPSTAGGQAGSTQNAAAQIKQSPQPFQNPKGALYGVKAGPTPNTGTGATKNLGGTATSKPGKSMPTGPTGGYKPKKNFGPSGLSKFYGR